MGGDELWAIFSAVVGVFVGGPLVGLMMVCSCVLGEYDAAVGKEFCLRKDDFVLVVGGCLGCGGEVVVGEVDGVICWIMYDDVFIGQSWIGCWVKFCDE